jgi:hypothetical protein
MANAQSTEYTLVLNDEERKELLRLLESSLTETHSEARRTEAPGYREQIHQEEALLRTLTEKVRRLGR